MNAERRKALAEIQDRISDICSDLEAIKDEEDEYMENIPENMQSGERYEKAEEAVNALESALDSLEEARDYIDTATE